MKRRKSFRPFGPEDALHGLRCQKCGYEAWSTMGGQAYCRQCGGLMIDEDKVDEDIEIMRRELGTAYPVRKEEEIEIEEVY